MNKARFSAPFLSVRNVTVNLIDVFVRLVRFGLIVAFFYIVYDLLLRQFFDGSMRVFPLFGLWVVTAYIVIPRVHRLLTNFYLPNYFVGRVRSPSGLLSDPVNLAFNGTEQSLHQAMQKAGWVKADPLEPRSFLKTAYCALVRRSYPSAPVGNMYLFNRVQDFAYEIEIGGSPNKRHHVRFWRTPGAWYLPGGRQADWLAAATYDARVGIKIATGQLDHFIHADVDEERDFIIATLKKSKKLKKLEMIKHFTNAYHDRNNGGDHIKTDGSLPFITL